MDGAALQFLKELLTAPSPSGYEQPVQAVVRAQVSSFADRVSTDWHGNVIAAVNPDGTPRIMLAGHCDQIGLMVKYIDEQGFVWVDSIGGWDIQMLIGQNMMIWGRQGSVNGVIARKAIHLLSPAKSGRPCASTDTVSDWPSVAPGTSLYSRPPVRRPKRTSRLSGR